MLPRPPRIWRQVIYHQPPEPTTPPTDHMTDDEFREHLNTDTKYGRWILEQHTEMQLSQKNQDLYSWMVNTSGDIIAEMDEIIRADIIATMSAYMGRRFDSTTLTLLDPLDDLAFFDIFMYYLTCSSTSPLST